MRVRIILLAALWLAGGALRATPLPEMQGVASKLTIYLAKGPANSCGPGCDHWIAVEGKVDEDAAARIRRFLQKVKDTQRPIYFNSPGGVVEQSFIIGRLLRSRKAVARVGHTLVKACQAGTQVDGACLKIKTAGSEVEAEIATQHSMCNSACANLFLGATRREVAPDATMAVHNSKMTLTIRGHPPPGMIEAFTERSRARASRERTAYVTEMGISRELADLIGTVKFETPHNLTRAELYRFGIDTRAVSETAWTLESASRPYLRKIALARKADGAAFRIMEWRLFCENKDLTPLMFIRELGNDTVSSVVLMAGSQKLAAFNSNPARVVSYEIWNGTIVADAMKTVLAAATVQMELSTLAPDGKAGTDLFDIDTNGLEQAWTKLQASCPAAPNPAKPAPSAPEVPQTQSPATIATARDTGAAFTQPVPSLRDTFSDR